MEGIREEARLVSRLVSGFILKKIAVCMCVCVSESRHFLQLGALHCSYLWWCAQGGR